MSDAACRANEGQVRGSLIRHVLWDWNGTLLDDLNLNIFVINTMCRRRGLPEIARAVYLDHFTFPVERYYRTLGFDFDRETMESVAREWVPLYLENLQEAARLHEDALSVLEAVRTRGLAQSVLSANHRHTLQATLRRYGVDRYFDNIMGPDDHHGVSKLDVGRAWLSGAPLRPDEVVLVGDTLHDRETAAAMGIRCILIARGHQSRARLESGGVPVLGRLLEVPAYLEGTWGSRRDGGSL